MSYLAVNVDKILDMTIAVLRKFSSYCLTFLKNMFVMLLANSAYCDCKTFVLQKFLIKAISVSGKSITSKNCHNIETKPQCKDSL